jgi:hypothetical protein
LKEAKEKYSDRYFGELLNESIKKINKRGKE